MFPFVLQFVVLYYGILLHRLRRSPLPEGAFGTTTFGADFIHIMFIGIAYIEPRDYRVVFLIQADGLAFGQVRFCMGKEKSKETPLLDKRPVGQYNKNSLGELYHWQRTNCRYELGEK